MQSKLQSAIESTLNTLSGFVVAWTATMFIIPLYQDKYFTAIDGFEITIIFAVISLVRNYFWRRFFVNRKYKRREF